MSVSRKTPSPTPTAEGGEETGNVPTTPLAELSLAELVRKRADAADALQDVEKEIYDYEGAYLKDTQRLGNVVKGFAGFRNQIASMRTPGKGLETPVLKFKESDRIFSNSSVTSVGAVMGTAAVAGPSGAGIGTGSEKPSTSKELYFKMGDASGTGGNEHGVVVEKTKKPDGGVGGVAKAKAPDHGGSDKKQNDGGGEVVKKADHAGGVMLGLEKKKHDGGGKAREDIQVHGGHQSVVVDFDILSGISKCSRVIPKGGNGSDPRKGSGGNGNRKLK